MIEKNQIILGDCMDIMAEMPDDYIDLTITSPPYNLGEKHHTGNNYFSPYPDDLPEPEYQEWQLNVLNEIYRITNDSGSLLYNHKNRIKEGVQTTPYQWILKSNWYVKQEIIWFNGSQNFEKIRFYPMTERIYWLSKKPDTKLKNVINHHDLFMSNEWNSEGTNKIHKRSFPEKLVSDLLRCFPESKIIFDPFSGSGKVACVCHKLKKDFIACEKDKDYHRDSVNRLTDLRSQGVLF